VVESLALRGSELYSTAILVYPLFVTDSRPLEDKPEESGHAPEIARFRARHLRSRWCRQV